MKDVFFQEAEEKSSTEDGSFDFSSIRPDNSLFKEELYIPNAFISIKHKWTKKQETWEFSQNQEIIGIINAAKFSELEKKYLRSVFGMQLLLQQFKLKDISFTSIKNKLRNML